jgi:ABC-type transport system involved in cytochrome bd biosynthesis fused ATPase/permease subunit
MAQRYWSPEFIDYPFLAFNTSTAFSPTDTPVLAGTLTIRGLVAFYTYGTRVFEPISSVMELYSRLQSVGASIRRARKFLDHESIVRDTGTERLEAASLNQGFNFQDVSFSYGRKPALSNVTFQIGAGERVAIVGASGSGKSTLARLLVRAANPDSGRILLEGLPVADYTLGSLRRAVCYVPQHPVLFQGAIRENLLYTNPRTTDEEMLERCMQPNLLRCSTGSSKGSMLRLALERWPSSEGNAKGSPWPVTLERVGSACCRRSDLGSRGSDRARCTRIRCEFPYTSNDHRHFASPQIARVGGPLCSSR